jgi:hypothetical protein
MKAVLRKLEEKVQKIKLEFLSVKVRKIFSYFSGNSNVLLYKLLVLLWTSLIPHSQMPLRYTNILLSFRLLTNTNSEIPTKL